MSTEPKPTKRVRDLLNEAIVVLEDAWADGTLDWSCADYARVMDRIAPELFDVSPSEARRQAEVMEQIRAEHIRDLAESG